MARQYNNVVKTRAKLEKIERFMYYMSIGNSQKAAAKLVPVSQQTVCTWLNEYPELRERIKAMAEGDPSGMGDKLTAFMAFVKVDDSVLYAMLLQKVAKFKKSLQPVFRKKK